MTFFLSNQTPVAAWWSLNYVKFPKKQTIGYMTMTKLDNENEEAADDPQVFHFSTTQVST